MDSTQQSEPPLAGRLEFTHKRPSWVVVRYMANKLEELLRKRDRFYDLAEVTQAGDLFTLFFHLKQGSAQ